ncbi:hypothetical protein BDP27DRAFT_1330774 [Rhodocollybia butyracea]|uniref:Uncharacterized protein n=1 Tax=Rhodocollybia butyracea TaxID=206335 RepID=A0A9P5PN64_9AGAR|nr:hypothetical protein BDP27DRAFT_1330774 [Rhodocollybia butyracea]
MYLELSLSLDSAPGSTVQLFPGTVSTPLPYRAARAVKLSDRSKQSYSSAFNLASSSASASDVVDTNYTGHIIISSYLICLSQLSFHRAAHNHKVSSSPDEYPP